MRSSRRLFVLIQLGAAVCSVLTPQVGFAYDHPLSDEAVRDAYSIGQDVKQVAKFLASYEQSLPVPKSGPDVAQIELDTPYAQVVTASAQHTVGYSAQQAVEDYQKRGDFVLVRVKILFTPTYTNSSEDYWRTVPVGLIQKEHMAATSVSGEPIYASDQLGDGSWIIGANVYITFSVEGVESDSVQVEVIPPGGAPVHATFDLDQLR